MIAIFCCAVFQRITFPLRYAKILTHTCLFVFLFVIAIVCCKCRSCRSRNAKILSLWRYCKHGFSHGINWWRL